MHEYSEQTERFIGLTEHLPTLEELAKSGTKLGEMALARALEEIDQLAQDEAVVDDLTTVWSAAQAELAQIDSEGATLIEMKLVTEAELTAMQEKILDRPEVRAAQLVKTAGSLAVKVAVAEDSPKADDVSTKAKEQPAKAEEESSVEAVQITILDKGIQIGTNGKFVRLDQRIFRNHRDYSVERKELLKALVENQGEYVSANDLWNTVFPGMDYDKNVVQQFKSWTAQLTFRKQALFEHNGKRGPASAYRISPKFAVSMIDVTKGKRKRKQTGSASSGSASTATTGTRTTTRRTRQKPAPTEEELQSKVNFPLNLTETCILAEVIENYAQYCRDHDITVIPDDIVAKLRDEVPADDIMAYSAGRGILNVRAKIVSDIIDYFEKEELVLEDLTNMDEEDPRRKFFDYLLEFDDSAAERSKILVEIAKGATSLEITYTGKTNLDIIATRVLTAVDQEEKTAPSTMHIDEEFEVQTEQQSVVVREAPEPVERPAVETATSSGNAEVSHEPETVTLVDDTAEDVETTEQPKASKKASRSKVRNSAPEILTNIEAELSSVLDLAIAQNLTARRGADGLRSVLPFVTTNLVKNADENGHISRGSNEFSYRDILVLTALKHFNREYTLPKGGKVNRRHINGIIDNLLKKAGLN